MSESHKKYLAVALILMVLAVGWSALRASRAYSNSVNAATMHSLVVTGEGKATGNPDVALLSLSVISEGGKEVETLRKSNTDKMNKIIDFIKSKGVESKDVKTESFSVSPRYQNAYCGYSLSSSVCPPPTIVGYTVSQTLSVKVRNFDVISDILSNVVSLGANNVQGPNFTVDDPAALKNTARADAFAKARTTAVQMATAGGFRLGKVIAVNESYYPAYDRYVGMAAPTASKIEANGGASIEAGSTDVTSSVTVTYELK